VWLEGLGQQEKMDANLKEIIEDMRAWQKEMKAY
jgi:hypothetical protein